MSFSRPKELFVFSSRNRCGKIAENFHCLLLSHVTSFSQLFFYQIQIFFWFEIWKPPWHVYWLCAYWFLQSISMWSNQLTFSNANSMFILHWQVSHWSCKNFKRSFSVFQLFISCHHKNQFFFSLLFLLMVTRTSRNLSMLCNQ